MIRQAQTYFAGAVSGAVLIAAAVATFAVFIAFQALTVTPIGRLGADEQVVPAMRADPPAIARGAAALGFGGGAAHAAKRGSGGIPGARKSGGRHAGGDSAHGAGVGGRSGGTAGGDSAAQLPPRPGDSDAATPGSTGAPGADSPRSGSPAGGSGSAGGGSGGGDSGGSGSTPGSGGGAGTHPAGPVHDVGSTVNNVVDNVDKNVLGGTLHDTGVGDTAQDVVSGVTDTVQGTVNDATGPNSTVGQTLTGVGSLTKNLLGDGRH